MKEENREQLGENFQSFQNFDQVKVKLFLFTLFGLLSVGFAYFLAQTPVLSKKINLLFLFFSFLAYFFTLLILLTLVKKKPKSKPDKKAKKKPKGIQKVKVWIFAFWVLFPVVFFMSFFFNQEEIDKQELHQYYVNNLISFEGTKYVWGGENRRGIDCSGLPRKSLRMAYATYAFEHRSGKALLLFLENWWYDASAKALMHDYRHYLTNKSIEGKIKSMPYTQIKIGDLAITKDGLHVLVYRGEGKWIQADPGNQVVHTQAGRTSDNAWFKTEVGIFRWRVFN